MRLFADDSTTIADPYLRRAYRLAREGLGTTSPNPLVGCVIVSDDRVVGEGWHERAGGPHAEVSALVDAGAAARGATAYVTLEPCSHHGRTPPCVDALVAHGIARVVIGTPDPSKHAGNGAARLRDEGVDVRFAADSAVFETLNEGWLSVLRRGRPWVTVKLGVTIDGKVSAGPGQRTAITGEGSRGVTMELRSRSDAVVIGSGTARVDDPALTVRNADGTDAARQPLRVILAADEGPGHASLLTDGRGPSALLAPHHALLDVPTDTRVIGYDAQSGLDSALRALAAEGLNSILVEPGPRLFRSLWDQGLIDELVVISAGQVLGEGAPLGMCGDEGSGAPPDGAQMRAVECAIAGDDSVTVWRRV